MHGLTIEDNFQVEIKAVISGLKETACRQFREGFNAAAERANDYALRNSEIAVLFMCSAVLVFLGVYLHRHRRRLQPLLPLHAEAPQALEISTDNDAEVQRMLDWFRNEKGEVMIDREPPDDLICPIGYGLITDPVRAADGRCYERKNIKRWLTGSDKSPIINITMPNKVLHPDWDKRNALVAFLGKAHAERMASNGEAKLTDDGGSWQRRHIGVTP